MQDQFEHDPISAALASRRLPHGRSGKKSGRTKGTSESVFDPRRAIGEFEIKLGSGKHKHPQSGEDGKARISIHELTSDENGFLTSLNIGGLTGIAILAGSRKQLEEITNNLSKPFQGVQADISDSSESHEVFAAHDHLPEEVQDNSGSDSTLEIDNEGVVEERIKRRTRAFEKNSFRNPKFWLQWKGRVVHQGISTHEQNMGYIVFTGNDCSKFEGTITCHTLGWDNLKIRGYKSKSYVGPSPFIWSDFTI